MSASRWVKLRFGAEKSQSRERAMATIQKLESLIPPCALPETAGEHTARFRASAGGDATIGNNDLWLAVQRTAPKDGFWSPTTLANSPRSRPATGELGGRKASGAPSGDRPPAPRWRHDPFSRIAGEKVGMSNCFVEALGEICLSPAAAAARYSPSPRAAGRASVFLVKREVQVTTRV